jgi:excisionase family DNA binding protein
MTCRTEPRHTTDRREDARAAPKPICYRLFCIEQAAEVSETSIQQICHWIMAGELHAYRVHGGRFRIDEVELAELLSAQ